MTGGSVVAQRLLPNVYSLGYKAGQGLRAIFQYSSSSATSPSSLSLYEIYTTITSFPALYKEWWLNLVANDPVHVVVETLLIVSIIYILMSSRKQKDWKARESRLTPYEEQELLLEWKFKTREPLVPSRTVDSYDDDDDEEVDVGEDEHIVVHKYEGRTMQIEICTSTKTNGNSSSNHIDTVLQKHHEQNSTGRTTRRKQQQQQNQHGALKDPPPQLHTVLNFATTDFLGFTSNPADEPKVQAIKDAALAALNRYGCGSCGPRGFYGTIDVHLELEKRYSEFCHVENAILYSDGASTCSSTVASFAKRGDLIVADEGIYEPLRTGIALSRAHVKYFKHNDVQDLKRVLQQIQNKDKQLGRKSNQQRRFIIVEGLYKNYGDICPLDQIVKLKHQYCYRLILDESYSFGTLGRTGRGLTELYPNLQLMRDVEITCLSLENAMNSIGGITIGTEEVIDHQRLNGSGYCFSASSPPFTSSSAIASLALLEQHGKDVFLQRLQDNKIYIYEKLKTWLSNQSTPGLILVTSDERSPIVIFQVSNQLAETEYLDRVVFWSEVVRESLFRGVAFVATGQRPIRTLLPPSTHPHLQEQHHAGGNKAGTTSASSSSATGTANGQSSAQSTASSGAGAAGSGGLPGGPPGLRMIISAAITHADIDQALSVLNESIDIVMNRFREESK